MYFLLKTLVEIQGAKLPLWLFWNQGRFLICIIWGNFSPCHSPSTKGQRWHSRAG